LNIYECRLEKSGRHFFIHEPCQVSKTWQGWPAIFILFEGFATFFHPDVGIAVGWVNGVLTHSQDGEFSHTCT
jgi:hypothetical protein